MILKFGTKLACGELYCVTKKKQPHIAYQSLYLFIYLSLQWKFLSQISQPAPIGASVFKFCVHLQVGKVYCVRAILDKNTWGGGGGGGGKDSM